MRNRPGGEAATIPAHLPSLLARKRAICPGLALALLRRDSEVSLVPRTDNRPKRRTRFCGDCGYELAPDNDGRAPWSGGN